MAETRVNPFEFLKALEAAAVKLQEEGKTAMFLAVDGKPAGILSVADPIQSTTAEAIRLSRATMSNIRQNLIFAFLDNALGIPAAAGVLYPFFSLERLWGDNTPYRSCRSLHKFVVGSVPDAVVGIFQPSTARTLRCRTM